MLTLSNMDWIVVKPLLLRNYSKLIMFVFSKLLFFNLKMVIR
jgi:hypothetical protein